MNATCRDNMPLNMLAQQNEACLLSLLLFCCATVAASHTLLLLLPIGSQDSSRLDRMLAACISGFLSSK